MMAIILLLRRRFDASMAEAVTRIGIMTPQILKLGTRSVQEKMLATEGTVAPWTLIGRWTCNQEKNVRRMR